MNYYNKYGQEYYNATVNLDLKNIYKPFLKLLPKKAHILDLGCGSGRDSKYFLSQGYRVTAIDNSEEMVKLSSNLIGQSTINLSFNELTYKNEFEGIWACASLLHIPKNQITNIIHKLIQSLKINGVLYISFKYGTKEIIDNERFFNNYNEELLIELFKDFPVIIKKIWLTLDPIRNIHWINGLIIKKCIEFDK